MVPLKIESRFSPQLYLRQVGACTFLQWFFKGALPAAKD